MRVGGGMAASVVRHDSAARNGVTPALAAAISERIKQHNREGKMLEEAMGIVTDLAVAFEHEGEADKCEEAQALGHDFMEMHSTLDCNLIIMKELKDGQHVDAQEDGTAFMARRVEELDAQRSRDGYKQHPLWKTLRREVWAVNHPDEPLPEQAQDELVVVSSKVVTKCPLTTSLLEAPVKSRTCGHTYSEKAIISYIQRKGGQNKCPVSGCNSIVTKDVLERDIEAERAVVRASKGKKRKAALELE